MALSELLPELVDPNAPAAPQPQSAQGQAPAAPKTHAIESNPTKWQPVAFKDPTTGHDLARDADGGVFLQSGSNIVKFSPQEASNLLANKFGEYRPVDAASVDAYRKDKIWDDATLADKANFLTRRAAAGIADGVAPIVRGVAGAAFSAAGKVSPLEHLSGEELLNKYTQGTEMVRYALGLSDENPMATAEKQAASEKALTQAAPIAAAAANIGGFILGGEAGAATRTAKALEGGAARIAESFGLGAEKAAKLGKYASEIATGAGINVAANTDAAWVNDEQLTAESQLHALGIGALWGAGGQLAADVLKGGASKAAQVFGAPRVSETAADVAMADAAEKITGTKPQGSGFGAFMRGRLEMLRDWAEKAQSKATGAELEDIQQMGGLRWSEEAKRARYLYEHHDEILEAGARDLTNSLKELHEGAEDIYQQTRDATMKRENIRELLKDADHRAIFDARDTKLKELENGYEQLQQATKTGNPMFGKGAALADIRSAYEEAHEALHSARSPEDVFMAMDQFKRSTQQAQKRAARVAINAPSEIAQKQAAARADLMFEVSERARDFLTSDVFGKAGEAQAAYNSRWNEMLRTDKFVQGQVMRQVGEKNVGPRFGIPNYIIEPDKIRSLSEGLGTTRTETAERAIRDNIAARKALAETIAQHFDLTASHAEQLQQTVKAADDAIKHLDHMAETVGYVHKGDAMAAAQAKAAGHGTVGATIAGMFGHAIAGYPGFKAASALYDKIGKIITEPATLMHQASAIEAFARRSQERVQGAVRAALKTGEAIAPAATRVAETVPSRLSAEKQQKKALKVLNTLNGYASNPEQMIDHVSALTQHIEHPGVQSASTMSVTSGLAFLMSKIPPPLYQNAVPSTKGVSPAANISATQRDQFLGYVDAVQRPLDFFRDLADGTATQQQAEVAMALAPKHFQIAQAEAMQAFAEGKAKGTYQSRLRVQRLLSLNIEPTVQPSLHSFVQQTAQQQSQQKPQQAPAPRSGKSTVAASLSSPLSNLKI